MMVSAAGSPGVDTVETLSYLVVGASTSVHMLIFIHTHKQITI